MKKVLSLAPLSHIEMMFAPEARTALKNEFEAVENTEPGQKSSDELREAIGDFDAVLTGWGSPRFTREVLEAASRRRLDAARTLGIRSMTVFISLAKTQRRQAEETV